MTVLPKVLVVGSGGVGTISALSLCLNDRSDVTLVVRSDYDKIMNLGYTINSCTYGKLEGWRPHHVAKSVADAAENFGPFDYILMTTKNIPDGPITCEDIIAPAVTPQSAIILIQNGVGIEEPMIERFPQNVILSGVSLIGSTNYNGVVEHQRIDSVFIGDFRKEPLQGTDKIINTFIEIYQNKDRSLNQIDRADDVSLTRWTKLVYNSVINTITTLVDLDVARCQINDANDTLFKPAMKEIIAIAKSEGILVPEETIDKMIHIGDGFFYPPSMCVDRRKNQLLELEIILGNPLKVARRNNVDTPILSTLYPLLKMTQFKIKEQIGHVTIDENDYTGNSDDYPKIFKEKNPK
jgi:2-dehydropantoate 2-reductase